MLTVRSKFRTFKSTMKHSQDIKPITYMKTKPAELIQTVTVSRRPVVITQNGEAKAVIQDIQSFERDREALLLLKLLAQGVAEADEGCLTPQDAVFERLEKQLS